MHISFWEFWVLLQRRKWKGVTFKQNCMTIVSLSFQVFAVHISFSNVYVKVMNQIWLIGAPNMNQSIIPQVWDGLANLYLIYIWFAPVIYDCLISVMNWELQWIGEEWSRYVHPSLKPTLSQVPCQNSWFFVDMFCSNQHLQQALPAKQCF